MSGASGKKFRKYFHRPPFLYKWWLPSEVIWQGDSSSNKVYITFDDGPDPEVTPWVLNELEKRGMKACFFLVGENVDKYPQLLEKLQNNGHQLGYHTYNHLNSFDVEKEEYIRNVLKNKQQYNAVLFRPPYGRITRSTLRLIPDSLQVVMWSLLSGDFDKERSSSGLLSVLKKETRSGDVIVFHDSQKAKNHLFEILPPYLDWLKENGFQSALLNDLKGES